MPKQYFKRIENEQNQDFPSLQSFLYDLLANAQRNLDLGPVLSFIGPVNAEFFVDRGAQLWIYNNAGAVAFVAFGATGIGVPTAANGIAIPANSYIRACSGADQFVRGSAATVLAYQVADDTTLFISTTE